MVSSGRFELIFEKWDKRLNLDIDNDLQGYLELQEGFV